MRRILVLRGGALGDFIVTLPALAALRERWPGSRIELIGNRTAGRLGLEAGLLDAVHDGASARWAPLHGSPPLPEELRGWLGQFDLIVNAWPDPDGRMGRLLPVGPGQRHLPLPAHPPADSGEPASRHYSGGLARALGLPAPGDGYRLGPWARPASLVCVENPAQPPPAPSCAASPPPPNTRRPTGPGNATGPGPDALRVALHPGSGSARKTWPAERWARVACALASRLGSSPLIVTGEAEPEGLLASCGEALRSLPLPELARRLAGCSLFLGHDSGVSHLAAAVGTPCVLLFGPTDPRLWAPPFPHVRVLQRGADCSSISEAEVLAAALGRLGAAGK